ncbi:MAG: substrate-binding domain-containing protein, partial [Akkermansiaceae bacterium]
MKHLLILALALTTLPLHAQIRRGDKLPTADKQQSAYYHREVIPLPAGETMEISSIALLPNKKIAVGTRRGDVWICTGAYAADLSQVKWTLYHRGLHEPLGMFYKNGWIHYTDRGGHGRMKDTNNDDRMDVLEVINNEWGINSDYHEYAFGSTPDKQGNVWATLCLTGSFHARSQWRGWVVRITPDGKMIPTASGVRSPGGIGFNAAGDTFYTDNQGKWNGTSCLKHAKSGSFTGCPTGNIFYKDAPHMGPHPTEPKSGSRIHIERKRIPQLVPPAVQLPHGIIGQSPTAVITDLTKNKFGPFAGQVLVGEQTHSAVQRVFLEKVNGVYQGAVFKFLNGFQCGIVPMRLSDDGTLFLGGTNRGWASTGGKTFSFERVRFTGKNPAEIKTMSANKDGFTLTFTQPIDAAAASNIKFALDRIAADFTQDTGKRVRISYGSSGNFVAQ